MEVFPLFSTPLYLNNVGEINYKEKLNNISVIKNNDSYISETQDLLNQKNISHIKKIIEIEMEKYVYEILKVDKKLKLFNSCSWMVIHEKGHYSPKHIHSNSMFSGILYLKCDEKSGKIIFSVPQIIPTWSTSTIDPIYNITESNIFNSREWKYQPKNGDIICFPSHLYHEVEPSLSENNRYCIAFNYILKGKIGTRTGFLDL